MILCFSLAVAAILFSLNGRYQISTYEGARVGLMPWMKIDTLTGRAWMIPDTGIEWIEVVDYGYVYTKPAEQKV